MFTLIFLLSSFTGAFAQQPSQDYSKFGKIATMVVTEDYPGQEVVEYKYEGRKQAAENKVMDSFRFEIMENGKKKFVTVRVTHDTKTGKALTITLEESE